MHIFQNFFRTQAGFRRPVRLKAHRKSQKTAEFLGFFTANGFLSSTVRLLLDPLEPADCDGRMDFRSHFRPGDIGEIVRLHGVLYALEYGFDETFEAYVAGPLAEFVKHHRSREHIWIAEEQGRIVGSVAIVSTSPAEAQLRWFLVDPSVRGRGLGTRLLQEAVGFCQKCDYSSVFLWTVSLLKDAARLYQKQGFHRVEQRPGRCWGAEVVEEKYVLKIQLDNTHNPM